MSKIPNTVTRFNQFAKKMTSLTRITKTHASWQCLLHVCVSTPLNVDIEIVIKFDVALSFFTEDTTLAAPVYAKFCKLASKLSLS